MPCSRKYGLTITHLFIFRVVNGGKKVAVPRGDLLPFNVTGTEQELGEIVTHKNSIFATGDMKRVELRRKKKYFFLRVHFAVGFACNDDGFPSF